MLLLNLLVLLSVVSDNSGQEENTIESLEDRIKNHLDTSLHLSLNNLLVSNEILASKKPEDSPGLRQAPDYI